MKMQVQQICDYCGGWTEEIEAEAEVYVGVAENSAFDVQTAARGRRRMCARCLIDMMDYCMRQVRSERQHDRTYG